MVRWVVTVTAVAMTLTELNQDPSQLGGMRQLAALCCCGDVVVDHCLDLGLAGGGPAQIAPHSQRQHCR